MQLREIALVNSVDLAIIIIRDPSLVAINNLLSTCFSSVWWPTYCDVSFHLTCNQDCFFTLLLPKKKRPLVGLLLSCKNRNRCLVLTTEGQKISWKLGAVCVLAVHVDDIWLWLNGKLTKLVEYKGSSNVSGKL